MNKILKIHPLDNLIVALQDLSAGQLLEIDGEGLVLVEKIPQKHKFSLCDLDPGDVVTMYGVKVGVATKPIYRGSLITVDNIKHASEQYAVSTISQNWIPPDNKKFIDKHFLGYHREDGKVGTRNYWIVFPLVFCENRNLEVIENTMLEKLGYNTKTDDNINLDTLINKYKKGASVTEILNTNITENHDHKSINRIFENVDGIKFLKHEGGCGGIRQDSEALVRLLSGYVANPNVAGATILSLGCQNAQFSLFEKALNDLYPENKKPIYILEQQKYKSEKTFIQDAIKQTFAGLIEANKYHRKPASLSHLSLGLECGGSDGFSGITANPSLGQTADLLVSMNGKAILSEFPELNGVEQELIHRCQNKDLAEKFSSLMERYNQRAKNVGSGFDMNPSPGNIKDGLITDAIKSAGAAKKGGTSPVVDVLDYTEQAVKPGLSLLCTPGNDVESTTGLAGSGSNIIVFTTGLGTPTGNPITPTLKMSSNSSLNQNMNDIIDFNAGTMIDGDDTIETLGDKLLELIIETASGSYLTKAERLGQNDFIPWKRGISL